MSGHYRLPDGSVVPKEWGDEVRRALGGEGEHVDPMLALQLWQDFSRDFHAGWLIADESTMGNFAAWLILRCERSLSTGITLAEPPPADAPTQGDRGSDGATVG